MISSVMVLAAQNAVAPEDLGVATSTTTFSRTIGASFGVSVFGAIYSNALIDSLSRRVPPNIVTQFSNRGASIGNEQIQALSDNLRTEFMHASEIALHDVFRGGSAVALLGFLIALKVREVPLRRRVKDASENAEGDATNMGRGETGA
jgi:hypothetical protein